MTQTRFTCTLTKTDEDPCQSYARVTIIDAEGASARGCPRHAMAALDGITRARVDWPDSKGLNQWQRTALELAEERKPARIARQAEHCQDRFDTKPSTTKSPEAVSTAGNGRSPARVRSGRGSLVATAGQNLPTATPARLTRVTT